MVSKIEKKIMKFDWPKKAVKSYDAVPTARHQRAIERRAEKLRMKAERQKYREGIEVVKQLDIAGIF